MYRPRDGKMMRGARGAAAHPLVQSTCKTAKAEQPLHFFCALSGTDHDFDEVKADGMIEKIAALQAWFPCGDDDDRRPSPRHLGGALASVLPCVSARRRAAGLAAFLWVRSSRFLRGKNRSSRLIDRRSARNDARGMRGKSA